MASQPLNLVFLSTLGLSLFLGNSLAFAQVNPSGSVVVPTTSDGSSTPNTNPNPSNLPPVNTATRFSCQIYNGQYTVMYQPQSQTGKYFSWAAPGALGGGWDAQKRCEAIASRLESYRPDGLQELQTAVENRENTICVTTEANASCRIVLTVPRGKDPINVRNSVFQNLTTADSGQQTTAINTYTNRNGVGADQLYNLGRTILGGSKNQVSSSTNGINLKPYLDPQDGGSASGLKNGVRFGSPSKPKSKTPTILNPRIFR